MNEWYKVWFASDDYIDVYSHRNNEDAEKLAELVLSEIEVPQNANVLDAACGFGRHSIIFAKKGFKVTGFDLSENLLKIAEERAAEENLKIDFKKFDLRTVELNKKFDVILNLFTSFGYFETDRENFAFPRKAFDLLNKNGFFILDYLNKPFVVKNLVAKSERELDSKKIIEERSIVNERVNKKITITNGNEEETFWESVKLYDSEFILKEFNRIGYKTYKIFGNYNGAEYDPLNSERVIIIFTK